MHSCSAMYPSQTVLLLYDVLLCITLLNCVEDSSAAKKNGGLQQKTKLIMRPNKMETCPGTENAGNISRSTFRLLEKGVYVHDFDVHIFRATPKSATVHIKAVKCAEAVSSNTCEYYQSHTFHNVDGCATLLMKGTFWAHYFEHTRPKLSCPIQPGFYQVVNGTIDMVWLERLNLPLENNIWLMTTTVSEKGHGLYMCLNFEAQFFRTRV